jgi:hypothetical protein
VPVVGSTAAYSQSHSYSSCTIQGGRSPNGHQRRRNQVLRPKRASLESHDPLQCWLFDQVPEVFLKAVCCSALAFWCRLRPVFHLTRCFLKSHQSDLPFL